MAEAEECTRLSPYSNRSRIWPSRSCSISTCHCSNCWESSTFCWMASKSWEFTCKKKSSKNYFFEQKVIFEYVPEYNWPVLWPIRFLTHFFFGPRHLVHPRPFWPIGLCWLLNYPGHFLEFGIALQRPKVPLSKPKAGRKKCKRQIIYCCQYCFLGHINNGLRMAST